MFVLVDIVVFYFFGLYIKGNLGYKFDMNIEVINKMILGDLVIYNVYKFKSILNKCSKIIIFYKVWNWWIFEIYF